MLKPPYLFVLKEYDPNNKKSFKEIQKLVSLALQQKISKKKLAIQCLWQCSNTSCRRLFYAYLSIRLFFNPFCPFCYDKLLQQPFFVKKFFILKSFVEQYNQELEKYMQTFLAYEYFKKQTPKDYKKIKALYDKYQIILEALLIIIRNS